MNTRQRRYMNDVAETVLAATGLSIDRAVSIIENPRILRRILRLETEMLKGRPRRRMAMAISRRLAELKRLQLRTCRGCGCTDRQGCPGGCTWTTEPEAKVQWCDVCNDEWKAELADYDPDEPHEWDYV